MKRIPLILASIALVCSTIALVIQINRMQQVRLLLNSSFNLSDALDHCTDALNETTCKFVPTTVTKRVVIPGDGGEAFMMLGVTGTASIWYLDSIDSLCIATDADGWMTARCLTKEGDWIPLGGAKPTPTPDTAAWVEQPTPDGKL